MLEPSEPPGAVAKRDILRRPAVVGTLETVDDELILRDELTATLFAIHKTSVWLSGESETCWRTRMAKPGKMTPEERAEELKREREFQELLERRKELDEKLAAERKRTAKS
jgi:hypothetical protein